MAFEFWQRWGAALDDVSFANAWAALGLARADRALRSIDDLPGRPQAGAELTWMFPDPATPVEGAPQEWAQAWARLEKPKPEDPVVRLRVANAPAGEPILPWYRLLGEARPAPRAASLVIAAPRAQMHIEWPLRLGCVSDSAWRVLDGLHTQQLWPASKMARMVRLGRDNANCDVLLHTGPAKALLEDLRPFTFGIKANLLMLQGGVEARWGEAQAQLMAALEQTRASGFVVLPASLPSGRLVELLNNLVRELSHAQPVDVASWIARGKLKGDFVAGFTPDITVFTLPQLAERFNRRLAAMPRGTRVDMSRVGARDEWLTWGVEGGGMRGGRPMPKMAARREADRHVAASSIRVRPEEMAFDHEDQGGAALSEVGEAMASAAPPPHAARKRAARFLQQKSFVGSDSQLREAKEGFVAGEPATVRVRIGEPEAGWDTGPAAFPVERLPQELEQWTLTLWLSEPEHLPAPLKGQIRLPRDGNSTEFDFRFTPRALPRFDGRLTVLHRGRVIQTAVLRAGVVSGNYPAAKDPAPKLAEELVVRHRLGELDRRREFDFALVANHDAMGRPLLTAVSAQAAWVKDLSTMPALAAQINGSLSPVAKSVKDYAEGLDGKKGEALLVQLAQHGGWLKVFLEGALGGPAGNPVATQAEYIQIVSTRADAVVPLEFVYDFTVPEDGAKVCKKWRTALEKGKCAPGCDHASGKLVCPMGFWGITKVIERHAVTPGLAKEGNQLYLQSETSRASDTLYLGGAAVLGSSTRVPKKQIDRLKAVISRHCGAPAKVAKDWGDWEAIVKKARPALLVALPHTDGKSTNVTMEIGNKAVKTITLRATHVFPPPTEGRAAPLVALIGCDVAGTADDYGNHVLVLRTRGAGIVIGTIATVFGEHAAQVAATLVEGMLPRKQDAPVRLGELIRDVRRKSLLANLLMPLCLVAYGDADWILDRKKPDG